MPQMWTCPRGHRWEGDVKGSVANPRTRVLCPVCGALAMTPVRVADGKPAVSAHQSAPEETLAETLQFSDLVRAQKPPEVTLVDEAVDRSRRPENKATKGPGAPDPAAGQAPAAAPPAAAAPVPGKEQPER
jgi:hypothetical protein